MSHKRFKVIVNVDVDLEAYMTEYHIPFLSKSEVEEDVANMINNSLENDLDLFNHFLMFEVEGV